MGKQIGNALMVDRLRVGNSSCSALQEKKEKNRKTEQQIMDTKEKTKKTDHGHNGQMNNNQSENCEKENIERTTQPKNQTSKKTEKQTNHGHKREKPKKQIMDR